MLMYRFDRFPAWMVHDRSTHKRLMVSIQLNAWLPKHRLALKNMFRVCVCVCVCVCVEDVRERERGKKKE
jgi:hypothetical protein